MISAADPRISASDDKAGLLWDLSFAAAREWELRTLSVQCSPTRRLVLLTDTDEWAEVFIREFKRDCEIEVELRDLATNHDWAVTFNKRSCWRRRAVT